MTNFEVRNARTGCLVRTFGTAKDALDFAEAHSEALGKLQAFEVERRERLLTGESELTEARARRQRRTA